MEVPCSVLPWHGVNYSSIAQNVIVSVCSVSQTVEATARLEQTIYALLVQMYHQNWLNIIHQFTISPKPNKAETYLQLNQRTHLPWTDTLVWLEVLRDSKGHAK